MELEFLDIPEELFYGHLFPYLKFNDLLRLRRVSKKFKIFSDGFIRSHFPDHEIEINETDHTIDNFIKLDIPVTHIYLNNSSGVHFFQKADIPQLVQLCASTITHLRVNLFSCCVSENENNFFLALTNLQHLNIATIDLPHLKTKALKKTGTVSLVAIPPHFRNLKSLMLNKLQYMDKKDVCYVQGLLEFCHKLVFVRLPDGFLTEFNISTWMEDFLEGNFNQPTNLPSLKFLDMRHSNVENNLPSIVGNFLPVLNQCLISKVQLLNVNSEHLEIAYAVVRNAILVNMFPVLSLLNIRDSIAGDEINVPHLQKLVITHTSKCTLAVHPNGAQAHWPALKRLDITIDSEHLQPSILLGQVHTAQLLKFLFSRGEREALKELNIRFANNQESEGVCGKGTTLPCPRAQAIVRTCRNLSSLTLTNWMGTNKTVAKLWNGLPNLEEVTLEYCRMLADVAFVGENKEEPTFLKLTNLNKFTLSGLEYMPKITDLVFELVFCHLTVKQFYLRSQEPIKSVTVKGIKSLLSGKFNNSIEKFTFRGWSLENISEEEFSLLKTQFRSSLML